jgi:hypothetical protein
LTVEFRKILNGIYSELNGSRQQAHEVDGEFAQQGMKKAARRLLCLDQALKGAWFDQA